MPTPATASMQSRGTPSGVSLNGKFLSSPSTAVNRAAAELFAAMDRQRGQGVQASLDMEVLTLRKASGLPTYDTLPIRRVGRLKGQPWEQLELPRHVRGRVLVNLCNLAPIAASRSITLIHDAQVFSTPESYSPPFAAWYRTVYRAVGRRHVILTISEFSRRELARFGIAPAERIRVVPPGADHVLRSGSDASILERLGLVRGRYVLAQASLQAHKNMAVLFDAFSRPGLAAVPLVLFGGPDRSAFEAAGRPPPATAVFAGRVSDDELRSLIEGAACLVCPSRTEGFGLPPVEAMVLGTPAVVAPCGAMPEACGDAALYASPDDPAEWEARIATVLSLTVEERMSMSDAGRRRAGAYTWDAAARDLLAVIAETAAESRFARVPTPAGGPEAGLGALRDEQIAARQSR
jgi:glycosyltransferase involved in cell wall biosynthesis